MTVVCSHKTIYVRFDLNDYSIPPAAVGRPLTLVASDTLVRILDRSVEVARHRRSYDRQQLVANPAHQQALLQQKRKASMAPSDRLSLAVPQSEAFLQAALLRGESVASQTRQLLALLEDYGAQELQGALAQALERGTACASSVAFLLHKSRRAARTPLPVDLRRRPELADLAVQPHSAEGYDELSEP